MVKLLDPCILHLISPLTNWIVKPKAWRLEGCRNETLVWNGFKIILWFVQSTHCRCSIKKGILQNTLRKRKNKEIILQNSEGNTCVRASFLEKASDLGPVTLLKKILWHKCFPVNFLKFLRAPYLKNTFGTLVLFVIIFALLTNLHIRIVRHQDNEIGDLSYLNKGKEVNEEIKERKAFWQKQINHTWSEMSAQVNRLTTEIETNLLGKSEWSIYRRIMQAHRFLWDIDK